MNLLLDIKNAMMPEAILTVVVLLVCVLTFALNKEHQNKIFHVSFLGIILSLVSFLFIDFATENIAFTGSFVSNAFTSIFRILILLGAVLTIFLSKDYISNFGKSIGEFYALILIATLGGMLLAGANDLIMLFVGLETLSISSYALCGYTKLDKLSNEAALKYLVIGAASTAVMLFGFSYLYGIVGETNIVAISQFLSGYEVNMVLVIAFIFILGGFAFKLSAVPFHSWAPDVYQGAPIPVTAYLSVVSKIAAFAALIRFSSLVFSDIPIFSIVVGTIAVITMTVGNLMAVGQTNIKRLMAYSSIAQAGYLLTGLAILTIDGITAIIFYLIIYLFMNFGTWAAIELFANITGKDSIHDYNGIAYKHRYYALGLAVCMLSLAGIPITAGFFGKFYLFKAIILAGYKFLPLLLLTLINTVVAVYYYLRVIKAMYVQPKATEIDSVDIAGSSFVLRAVLALTVAAVVIVGVFATPFIELSEKGAKNIVFKTRADLVGCSQVK